MIEKLALVVVLGVLSASASVASIEHPDCPLNGNPSSPVHLPYPNDCTKFYKCNGKYAYEMDCQAGLHWNKQAQYCDYPSNANCDNDDHGIGNFGDEIIEGHPGCDPDEDPAHPTHLPYPDDCTKFYKCNHGNAHPINCPKNLHWNVEKDYCDYPNLAKCDASLVSARSASRETAEINPACLKPNEDPQDPTLLPYPGDCEKFYICNGGYAVPMECPAGLHWDTTENRCNWPLLAGCRK